MNLSTGTPISQLPTGTIDGLTAVFPLTIGMPSSPQTIRESLSGFAQYLQAQGQMISGSYSLLDGRYQATGTAASGGSTDGWNSDTNTWTFTYQDAPIYNVSVNANVTGTMGIGMKVQLTNLGLVKNFFIQNEIYSGTSTYLSLYGGTDYSISGTITDPKYSQAKAPFGFPMSPAKWTVTLTDSSDRSQATPTQNTWYNPGSLSISIPIGVWQVGWQAFLTGISNAAQISCSVSLTLSTANNSESDKDFSGLAGSSGASATIYVQLDCARSKLLTLASKTAYYVNLRTLHANMASITMNNSAIHPLQVTAVCAYL